ERAGDRDAGRLERAGGAVRDPDGGAADSSHCLKSCTALTDEGPHFAADSPLLRGAARDETGRGREDRDAHPAEHARKTVLPGVDPAARLRHALQAGDDPLAVAAELEVDDQGIEGLALLHVVVADVSLLL